MPLIKCSPVFLSVIIHVIVIPVFVKSISVESIDREAKSLPGGISADLPRTESSWNAVILHLVVQISSRESNKKIQLISRR